MTTRLAIELVAPTLDDCERLTLLTNRAETFDCIPRVLSSAEMREELERPSIDLQRDARMAIVDGELAGWVLVDHSPTGVRQEKAFINGVVDPLHRGAGIGRTMMTWGLGLATDRLGEIDNDLPKYIRVFAYEQIGDLHRMLARLGFQPVRWFEDLLMPLASRPPVAEPDGVSIVAWPADRSEELRTVKNVAFEDHWGSTPVSVDEWVNWVGGFGRRLDLSFAAIDVATGDFVGHCLNAHYSEDEALLGRRDGWIDSLGTLREWRGRGVASSMIAHSLDVFASAGFTHASIGVDSANPTGASRLYRNIGFELQHRIIASELRVV